MPWRGQVLVPHFLGPRHRRRSTAGEPDRRSEGRPGERGRGRGWGSAGIPCDGCWTVVPLGAAHNPPGDLQFPPPLKS